MDSSIDLLQVLGRLHPVLVHFPIALLVLAGFLELFRRKDRPSDTAIVCIAVGSLGAALAAWAGWHFAEYDGPGPSRTLWLHRWGGVLVAALSVLCLVFGMVARRGQPRASSVFRGGVILTALLVGFVAHQGGKSVWGEGFVFELLERKIPVEDPREDADDDAVQEAPATPVSIVEGGPVGAEAEPSTGDTTSSTGLVPSTPSAGEESEASDGPSGEDRIDYATRIQPIFEASCYKCHGPKGRAKAGLRLSDMSDVFAGDPEYWIIQPGDASESLLYERITLPPDHEDFMPATGDPLTGEQVALVRAWIDQGAEWTATSEEEASGQSGDDEEVGHAADAAGEEPELARSEPLMLDDAQREERDEALGVLRERGAYANPVALDTDEVEVNLGLLTDPADDASLALLAGLEPCLVALDLSRTRVTSAGLERLVDFPRLRRLRLDQTFIGDEALRHVARLRALEYLNLVATSVTDEGIAKLEGLESLRKLFLWQTQVTDAGVEALSAALPGLAIVRNTYTPLEVAADTAEAASAPCCDAAAAAGRTCDHPCCVEAATKGEVCPECSA